MVRNGENGYFFNLLDYNTTNLQEKILKKFKCIELVLGLKAKKKIMMMLKMVCVFSSEKGSNVKCGDNVPIYS